MYLPSDSCHLRLTLGRAPLCRLILVCVSQFIHNTDCWMLLERRKLPLNRWPSRDKHIIRIKKRALVRQTCSILEQFEPWTESQLNHRWTWVCCALNLWKSSRRIVILFRHCVPSHSAFHCPPFQKVFHLFKASPLCISNLSYIGVSACNTLCPSLPSFFRGMPTFQHANHNLPCL